MELERQSQRIRVDLDNTLCKTDGMAYADSTPMKDRIRFMNQLFNDGHLIVVESGRHWNNLELTKAQLQRWGLRYHTLVLGKFPGDVLIDDKAITFEGLRKKAQKRSKGL